MRIAHLVLGLLAFSVLACSAGAAKNQDPSRGIFPGARFETDSSLVLTRDMVLRMPGTSKVRADLPEGTSLTRSKTIKIRSQGKAYEVELWNGIRPDASGEGGFGETVAVLAVIPEGANAPTDVAEVASDRETYLNDKPVAIGADEAFEVFNAHLNTGEDFNNTNLFHLRDGRLRRIAEVFTKAERTTDCAESFREKLTWQVQPQTATLPNIVADVETVHAPKDVTQEDCPHRKVKERREHSRTAYRWDASKDRYVKEAEKPAKRK